MSGCFQRVYWRSDSCTSSSMDADLRLTEVRQWRPCDVSSRSSCQWFLSCLKLGLSADAVLHTDADRCSRFQTAIYIYIYIDIDI